MPTALGSHDITIADADGTTNKTGFMLYRARNGLGNYRIEDAQTIAPRITTEGELTHSELPPLYGQVWYQEDWRAGLGGVNHRLDPKKIAISTKIDASVSGKLRLARELYPASASTANGGVDSAPNSYIPSGFATVGTEEWSFQGRDVYSWDYTNKQWDIGTEPHAASLIYRNGVEFNTRTYVPSWYPTAGTSPTVAADSPSNYLYKLDTDANWTRAADNPGGTTNSQPKYFAIADGKLWGGNWSLMTDSAANLDEALDASETGVDVTDGTKFVVDDIILIDDELMAVDSISVNTLTVTRAFLGTTGASHSNGTDVTIRIADGERHTIRNLTTAPTTWGAAVSIGGTDSEITALVGVGTTLIVCKTNGLWAYYPSGDVENLTPEFENMAHPDNFRGAFNWNGHVLLPLGAGGMMDLWEGEIRDVSMLLYAPEQTALHGRVCAIHGEPTKLYILLLDPSSTKKYYILMAEWAEFEGTETFRWHHVGEITYTTSTVEEHAALMAMGIPSGTIVHHRLWVGIESAGSNAEPYLLPDVDDVDDGFTNDTDALVQFTIHDKNFPQVNASYATLDVESANLGIGGRQWEFEFRKDKGSWLSTLSDAAGNADGVVDVSPTQTMNFPDDTTAKLLEVRAYPKLTSVGITSPELLSFRVTYQLRFDQLELIPVQIHIADGLMGLNGAIGACRPKADLAQLRTWDRDAAAVKVVDAEGTSHDCVFVPGAMKVQRIRHAPGQRPEYVVSCVLAEV